MPKFKVTAVSKVYLETEIEAENLEQAQEIALELDGGEFIEIEDSAEWETFWADIEEI